MRAPERDEWERLARFWDAFVQGAADTVDPPDPALTETVRQFHARRPAPDIDPTFQRRLEAQLIGFDAAPGAMPEMPAFHPGAAAGCHSPNGRAAAASWRIEAPNPPRAIRGRWPLLHLAAAALILLALAGGLAAVRFVTTERPTARLEAADKAEVETLLDVTVEGAAEKLLPLSIERWTFAPGPATLTVPPLDGPQWIVADGGTLVAIVAGAEHELAPGTSLVVPAGQQLMLSNQGQREAFALRGVAAAAFALEEYDPSAISKQVALDTQGSEVLPPGASHVLFERFSLQPGSVLRIEPATGRDWVGVVSGQLGLTLVGDGLPRNWQSGREREVAAAELLPRLDPGTRVSLRNIGDDPLVLLRLRVTPLAEGAP